MKQAKRFISLAIVFVMSLCFCVTAFAATKTLGVSEIDQNKTYWCWAACGEMIGKYYDNTSTKDQYDIVQHIKGNTNNQGGSTSDVCAAVKYASNNSVTFKSTNSALSFSSCKTQINNYNPFVVWLEANSSTTMSHVIVAAGYKDGTTDYLYILDSSPSVSAQYFTYTALVNGTTGTLGTRKYERTMYKK